MSALFQTFCSFLLFGGFGGKSKPAPNPCEHQTPVETLSQQFAYGFLSEGVFAEILRKVRGNLRQNAFSASGKDAESLRKFAEMFLQWPPPERPLKWTAAFRMLEGPQTISKRSIRICLHSSLVPLSILAMSRKDFWSPHIVDLLMGLFRGAVFRHGGGALKQPIKDSTETPTSTLALMGRFPSLMGRFPTLTGRFADFVLRGRLTSWKSPGKQPIKKRGIKRLLIIASARRNVCWDRQLPSQGRFLEKCRRWAKFRDSEIPSVLLGLPWPALKGPLRSHFWKKRRSSRTGAGESSGNSLEASNALNCRVWASPSHTLDGKDPREALRAFPGSFRDFSGISSGKSQPYYWGCGLQIWFWRAQSQTPNWVSFLVLAEFRGESSVSSSQPIICMPKRTH